MTKKDRIAISISISWVLIMATISAEMERGANILIVFGIFSSPVILYWIYRFIQNDLAFLQRNPKTANDKGIGEIATDVVRTFKTKNKADELLKWNELLEKGAITQEEYDKAKRDLLG